MDSSKNNPASVHMYLMSCMLIDFPECLTHWELLGRNGGSRIGLNKWQHVSTLMADQVTLMLHNPCVPKTPHVFACLILSNCSKMPIQLAL